MLVFGQFMGSYVHECLRHFTERSLDVEEICNYIHYLRFHEVLYGFTLTKKITDRVTDEHYQSLTDALKLPYDKIRRHLKIEGVHERMLPPRDVVTNAHYQLWIKENGYTQNLFLESSHYFYSLFTSLIPCICVAEIQKHCPVNFNGHVVTECLIQRYHYRIPENFKVILFNDESGIQRGLSFNIDYDSEYNMYITVFTLKLTLSNLTTCYINPWIYFLSNGVTKNMYSDTLDPLNYKLLDEFDIHSLPTLTRFMSVLEINIYSCWTIEQFKMYATIPNIHTFGSDFTNSFVFCLGLPINNSNEPQTPPGLSRQTFVNIIQQTKEKHLNHIMVRNKSSSCVVSIINTSFENFFTVYVSTLQKIGTRYRTAHIVFITRDSIALTTFLSEHWNHETKWIDEDYFSQYAIRFHRSISSNTNIFHPIPIGRVFMRDTTTFDLIAKGLWKLQNCFCSHCHELRHQASITV